MKKWDEAEKAFKEAWALKQAYDIAGNLGDVEVYLGKFRDAAEHLEYSLRNWPAGQEAAKKRTAERFVEAKKSVGTLTLKVSEGAEITVNGKPVGKSPLAGPVFIEPGAATVEAKIGEKSGKKTVALDVGESREIEIAIAGEAAAVGPVAAPGEGAGQQDPSNNRDVGPSREPTSTGGPNMTLVYVGASVAIVGLAAGIGFTMASSSKAGERDDARGALPGPNPCAPGTPHKAQCADIAGLDDDATRLSTFGIASFAVAGVVGVATATYALWPRAKRPTSGARVTPVLGSRAGGLTFSGTF